MKKPIIFIAVIIIISISASAQNVTKKHGEDEKTRKQISALANELADSLSKGNTNALERILANDYGDIGLLSNLPTSKNLLISIYKETANNNQPVRLKSLKIDLNKSSIRIYENTAVIVGPVSAKWVWANNRIDDVRYLTTCITVRRNGTWQIVATHFSEAKT
ncbi:MAG: nuclear transport factor 2 family protein [Blastocatellia bacterium]|nr:nuclear transport factor 2 family protein [Blastocatellia bacterium]